MLPVERLAARLRATSLADVPGQRTGDETSGPAKQSATRITSAEYQVLLHSLPLYPLAPPSLSHVRLLLEPLNSCLHAVPTLATADVLAVGGSEGSHT